MNKKHYAIAVSKFIKSRKRLQHQSFYGTWEELEDYLRENNFILEGWDCMEED